MGFKKILGKVIPVAASVASSGLLGGGVAKSITDALGLGKDASDEDIEAALAKASPEQFAALKRIEAQVTMQAEQLGFKREELVFKDRDSARRREMAVKDSTPKILAFTVMFGFFGVLVGLFFIPEPSHALTAMLGSLGTLLTQMAAYYWGTSRSSAAKDETLKEALKGRQ